MENERAALEALKVADLRAMAKEKGLKGYSTLKKGELIDLIAGAPAEIDEAQTAQAGSADSTSEKPLTERPFSEITPEVAWNAFKTSMKYHPYYAAAVNLYGVIKKDEMANIIEKYTGEKTNLNVMTDDIRNNITFAGQYCLYGDYIVSDLYRENGMEGIVELIEATSKYKKYIPEEKDEFLNYQNKNYVEITPALKALESFVKKEFHQQIAKNEDVLDTFMGNVSMYCLNQTIVENFDKMCLEFGIANQPPEKIKKLRDMVLDVYYNTRLWSRSGHTFAECEDESLSIKNDLSKSFEDIRKEFAERTKARFGTDDKPTVKVGRNDPCPCGSGLKYKKCCGKNA